MLIDAQLNFNAAGGDIFTATGNSSNVIDMGAARDLGGGHRLRLVHTFTAVTSNAALVITLVGDTTAGMATSPVTVSTSRSIVPVAGQQFVQDIGPHPRRQFYRLTYTLTGGTSPSITVTSALADTTEVKEHSNLL